MIMVMTIGDMEMEDSIQITGDIPMTVVITAAHHRHHRHEAHRQDPNGYRINA